MVSREAQPCCFSVFIVLHMINKKGEAAASPIFLVSNTVLIVVFVVVLMTGVAMLFAVTAATTATVTLRCLVLAEQENRARNN